MMNPVKFENEDFIIPASDGVRLFENDAGGISIMAACDLAAPKPNVVAVSVGDARRAAEAMLRLCTRIEVGRAAYEAAREQEILMERRQRASNP